MKRACCLLVAVFCCFCMAGTAWAGFSIGLENRIIENAVTNHFSLYESYDLAKNVQLFGFSTTSESYCEGYAGVGYLAKSWLQISAGLGLETNPNPWRITASLWTGKGPASLLAIYENGGSGYWYKILATYSLGKYVAVGVHTKRFMGIGPYLQVKMPFYTNCVVYVVPGYDWETKTIKTIVSISLNY
ncbi:MAG: hypothetical protein Q7R99_01715 [bacterium]|nr:hypothetical protein [bacterium]